ncbi:hypothetical protein [Hahella ganghwensis]|uniref:hypothetical protein n=1 Tax=Hahella ganghwensis TaxID=286420 RepID=UPI000379D5C1|nr:hypothetical protein [Hahella ganghwensis]
MWRLASRRHPSGPNRWEDHKIRLSGTEITYSAPKNNHELIDYRAPLLVTENIYDPAVFERNSIKNKYRPLSCGLALKDWVFFGLPLLEGRIGDLKFHVTLARMPEFSSLFRPRHLECSIERYIYASPNSIQVSGLSRQHWKIREFSGFNWVNYQYQGNPGLHNAEEVVGSVWHLPITDEHMLNVDFKQIIRIKNSRLHETYQKLIEQVMSSFTIELSEDAQKQKEAVQSEYPDERLSEHLPPYEFETYPVFDEFELSKLISEQHNNRLPMDEWDKLVQEEDKIQRQKAEEAHQRVLASHLRFRGTM